MLGIFDDFWCLPYIDRQLYLLCVRSNPVTTSSRKLTSRSLWTFISSFSWTKWFCSKWLLPLCTTFLQDEHSRNRFSPGHFAWGWPLVVCSCCNLYTSISFCALFFSFNQPTLEKVLRDPIILHLYHMPHPLQAGAEWSTRGSRLADCIQEYQHHSHKFAVGYSIYSRNIVGKITPSFSCISGKLHRPGFTHAHTHIRAIFFIYKLVFLYLIFVNQFYFR